MGFGIFIHRSDSIYDDSPAERYQFPSQYLRRAETMVGDWIIYYEPSKIFETRGYFAVAKVQRIMPDPTISGMFIALIEPGSYLDFSKEVPFRGSRGYVEQGLLNLEGRLSGRAQSAVRPLSNQDFRRIVSIGLADEMVLPRADADYSVPGLQEDQSPYHVFLEQSRSMQLVARAVRDRVFRNVVLRAYQERCAVTGLRLINGGGRAEVAAAHIKPVAAMGPDIVSNGIALSGTAHWMFDRGLISISDDLEILISRQINDAESIKSLINKSGRALGPRYPYQRPHPSFLAWHRDNCFKH